jgi:hypothetical protein
MHTNSVPVIYADAIREWVAQNLAPECPEDAHVSVISRPWHCKGESSFFAAIDVDAGITVQQLRSREVAEHTRGAALHFYVDDVIAAAVGTGALNGNHFHVLYRW